MSDHCTVVVCKGKGLLVGANVVDLGTRWGGRRGWATRICLGLVGGVNIFRRRCGSRDRSVKAVIGYRGEGSVMKSGAVRGQELFHDGFDELGAFILVGKRGLTAFVSGDPVDICGVFEVVDEYVDFRRVVKGRSMVGDVGAKLQVVTHELGVL